MLNKLLSYLPKNIGAIIGIVQALIKLGKEICTLLLDILYPVIPNASFKGIVEKVRGIFNTVDEWLEKIKVFLLRIGVN